MVQCFLDIFSGYSVVRFVCIDLANFVKLNEPAVSRTEITTFDFFCFTVLCISVAYAVM